MRQLTLVGLVTGIALLFRKRKEAIVRSSSRPHCLASMRTDRLRCVAGSRVVGPSLFLHMHEPLLKRRLTGSSQGGGAARVNDGAWSCRWCRPNPA